MDALDRAHSDVADGRAWKARDRLNGLLAHRPDAAVAEELARVNLALGELPAAGALWFVTGDQSAAARGAVAAWREKEGDAAAQWRTIPRPLRDAFGSAPHMVALRADADRAQRASIQSYQRRMRAAHPQSPSDRVLDVVVPLTLAAVGLSLIAVLGIGLWTIWGWVQS